MEYSFEEMEQIKKEIEEKLRLEMEMEQEIAAVEDNFKEELKRLAAEVIQEQQPPTMNEIARAQYASAGERGNQMLRDLADRHVRNLEKQRKV